MNINKLCLRKFLNSITDNAVEVGLETPFISSKNITAIVRSMSNYLELMERLGKRLGKNNDPKAINNFNLANEAVLSTFEGLMILINKYDEKHHKALCQNNTLNRDIASGGLVSTEEMLEYKEELLKLERIHAKYLLKSRGEYKHLLSLYREKINENKNLRRENAELDQENLDLLEELSGE